MHQVSKKATTKIDYFIQCRHIISSYKFQLKILCRSFFLTFHCDHKVHNNIILAFGMTSNVNKFLEDLMGMTEKAFTQQSSGSQLLYNLQTICTSLNRRVRATNQTMFSLSHTKQLQFSRGKTLCHATIFFCSCSICSSFSSCFVVRCWMFFQWK